MRQRNKCSTVENAARFLGFKIHLVNGVPQQLEQRAATTLTAPTTQSVEQSTAHHDHDNARENRKTLMVVVMFGRKAQVLC